MEAVDYAAALYNEICLLAHAENEADNEQSLYYLRRAIDIAPRFEIPLFRNAYYSEMRLRMQDDLSLARVREVIKQYDEVPFDSPRLLSAGGAMSSAGGTMSSAGGAVSSASDRCHPQAERCRLQAERCHLQAGRCRPPVGRC